MATGQLVQVACKKKHSKQKCVVEGALSRVCILFISTAVAEARIFTSGLFIVVILRGNTPCSLYKIKEGRHTTF